MDRQPQSIQLGEAALDGVDIIGAGQDVNFVPQARNLQRPMPADSRFGTFARLACIGG